MKPLVDLFWLGSSLLIYNLFGINSTLAQIVPDGTLPVNSLVNSNYNNILINGGTRVGGNLFHSFKDFSIPTGNTTFFNNAIDIQNIITRITGSSISNIDGTIKANGTANLFFLNPNGIIFGSQTKLNIGGSFLASTASSLIFADQSQFNITNPQSSLLTINLPVGLQFGQNPGAINLVGLGHNLTYADSILPIYTKFIRGNNSTSLQVLPGKSLALIGGEINLQGAVLIAPGGQIDLGSVNGGKVGFNQTSNGWIFDYQSVPSFADINLSQKSLVDASSDWGGGFISVQGRNVILTGNSVMLIQNEGINPVGDISINASESVQLSGSFNTNVLTGLENQTIGVGQGGDIKIVTKKLVTQGASEINETSFGAGQTGNIILHADDSIDVGQFSGIQVINFASGNAGNVNLWTKTLNITGGAGIDNLSLGSGYGGQINVNVSDSVLVSGFDPSSLLASFLGATTVSTGNANSLTINTSKLMVENGGKVESSTLASGNAGHLTINASESVEVSGEIPFNLEPSLLTSSARVVNKNQQQLFMLPAIPTGMSGDVTINTPKLSVTDGGLVNVKNQGSGNGGTLDINGDTILLNNSGGISATTINGEGGNIFLAEHDIILNQGSTITATAGGSGNGGNLHLNTQTLTVLDQSSITANAIKGRGGNITIDTQGLFLDRDSQITAVSQLGINGIVLIKTPDIDPSKGLIKLSQSVEDASNLINNACEKSRGSNFYLTGRGGLPPSPSQSYITSRAVADLGITHPQIRNISKSPLSSGQSSISEPIVEATGWAIDHNGKVILIASTSTVSLHSLWLKSPPCPG